MLHSYVATRLWSVLHVTSQRVTFQNKLFFLLNRLWDFNNKYILFVCTTQRLYSKIFNIGHRSHLFWVRKSTMWRDVLSTSLTARWSAVSPCSWNTWEPHESAKHLIKAHKNIFRHAVTYVSVGQRDGLHEVDSLGEHLDQGEDVSGFDRIAQCVQPGCGVGTFLPGKALLGVLGYDVVFPRLPMGWTRVGAGERLRCV